MSEKVTTRACITGFSADAKKVVVKILLDASDIGACEDLMGMRGKMVVLTVEESQQQMDLEDGYE